MAASYFLQNVNLHDTLTNKSWKLSNLVGGGKSGETDSEQGSKPGSASSSVVGSPSHSRKGINLLDNVVRLSNYNVSVTV